MLLVPTVKALLVLLAPLKFTDVLLEVPIAIVLLLPLYTPAPMANELEPCACAWLPMAIASCELLYALYPNDIELVPCACVLELPPPIATELAPLAYVLYPSATAPAPCDCEARPMAIPSLALV